MDGNRKIDELPAPAKRDHHYWRRTQNDIDTVQFDFGENTYVEWNVGSDYLSPHEVHAADYS